MKLSDECGNVVIELAFAFSLFVSLIIPFALEFSRIVEAQRQLDNSLIVLGRAWSLSELQQSEKTLVALATKFKSQQGISFTYECKPNCLSPDARLTLRLQTRVDSLIKPLAQAKGTFARDAYSK